MFTTSSESAASELFLLKPKMEENLYLETAIDDVNNETGSATGGEVQTGGRGR